jgi:hypothetical protein
MTKRLKIAVVVGVAARNLVGGSLRLDFARPVA